MENSFAFVASAMVPIGTAAQAGTLTLGSATVAVGKLGISTIAGDGASKVTMEATGDQTLSMLVGMTTSMVVGHGLNAIDNKY